jgi:hypothetical protein
MAIKRTGAALAAGIALYVSAAQAGDIAACPDDYSEQAVAYVESRLTDARGARIEIVSEPYRVAADVNGYSDVPGWGVDVRVKSRLPTGSFGGYVAYTVIFVDGRPVALGDDAATLERV